MTQWVPGSAEKPVDLTQDAIDAKLSRKESRSCLPSGVIGTLSPPSPVRKSQAPTSEIPRSHHAGLDIEAPRSRMQRRGEAVEHRAVARIPQRTGDRIHGIDVHIGR